jgi:hypothetical protein
MYQKQMTVVYFHVTFVKQVKVVYFSAVAIGAPPYD